ncbi:IS66 family insertion sequence element accessory protein TnpA [Iodobacter fluviatilis]
MWGRIMTHQQRRALWLERVRDWRASGLSMAEFCRRHDLKRPTLAAWVKRDLPHAACEPSDFIAPTSAPVSSATQAPLVQCATANPTRMATTVAGAPSPAFTLVATELPLNAHSASMCLLLPGGARLTLPITTSADWLATLLRGLP